MHVKSGRLSLFASYYTGGYSVISGVVDKVALAWFFSQYFAFTLSFIISHRFLSHIHLFLALIICMMPASLINCQTNHVHFKLMSAIQGKIPFRKQVWTFFSFSPNSPHWATASSLTRILDNTQRRRTTVGRTHLDEWLACRRDFYLTTHNSHNRQTSILPVGFEPTTSAGERPQIYALNRAATAGTGKCRH
jgi:hypothetical protein